MYFTKSKTNWMYFGWPFCTCQMQKKIAQSYKPSIIDVSCIFWQTTIIIYLLVEWLTFTGLNNLQFEFLASFERLFWLKLNLLILSMYSNLSLAQSGKFFFFNVEISGYYFYLGKQNFIALATHCQFQTLYVPGSCSWCIQLMMPDMSCRTLCLFI